MLPSLPCKDRNSSVSGVGRDPSPLLPNYSRPCRKLAALPWGTPHGQSPARLCGMAAVVGRFWPCCWEQESFMLVSNSKKSSLWRESRGIYVQNRL